VRALSLQCVQSSKLGMLGQPCCACCGMLAVSPGTLMALRRTLHGRSRTIGQELVTRLTTLNSTLWQSFGQVVSQAVRNQSLKVVR